MIRISSCYIIKDFVRFCLLKSTKIHKADVCLTLARIMSFKISGLSSSTKMYLSSDFYTIIMGGGCVIQDLVFCGSRKFSKKAEIMLMGVGLYG